MNKTPEIVFRGRMCEVGLARLRAQGGSAEGAAGLHPDVLDLA